MEVWIDDGWSWGFLALSLWCGAFTWNALRPIRTPASIAIASFFAGWLTVELAMHHVVWQLVAASAFIWQGGLEQWPGWVGLGVFTASWATLSRLHQRGELAQQAMVEALSEGLPMALPEEGPEALGPVRWKHILRPFFMDHPRVKKHRDRIYREVDGLRLKVDVYHHEDEPEGAPVLLFVHGGGWILGFKEYQALPMLHRMASKGWVCMSIDYRLSPKATFPDHIVDVKHAIAWAKEHAAEFGGDPSFIAISGNSAGGHLASLAALTWDEPRFQPGFEEVDTRVAACVSFYGVYDWLDRAHAWPGDGMLGFLERVVMKKPMDEHREDYLLASPIEHVRSGAPPFLIVHGDKDTLVPVGQAHAFVAALRDVSDHPVVYMEIPDAQHAFEIFRSVRGHHTLRGVYHFLRSVHRRSGAGEGILTSVSAA